MGELVGAGPEIPYPARAQILVDNGIAVWDVLASSVRPGSMDSAIDTSTARPNNFETFLNDHPELRMICFNGQAAARLFDKLVPDTVCQATASLDVVIMPSTSPAYAAMNFADKLEKWSAIRAAAMQTQPA